MWRVKFYAGSFFVLPQTLQTRFDVEISLIFHIIGKVSRQENKMVWGGGGATWDINSRKNY